MYNQYENTPAVINASKIIEELYTNMNKIKPISPYEINTVVGNHIPDFVINVVNNLIGKHWNGRSATIKQKEIKEEILKVLPEEYKEEDIYGKKWMDFEQLYVKEGWKVVYDKPAYNESYDATFEFTSNKVMGG